MILPKDDRKLSKDIVVYDFLEFKRISKFYENINV